MNVKTIYKGNLPLLLKYVCMFWPMFEQLAVFNSRSTSSVKHDIQYEEG